MATSPDQLSVIADMLAEDLKGLPFAILKNDRYIVLISDQFGVATVVGDRDAGGAHKAALEIARQAGLLGIAVQVHPYVVSDRTDGDGDIFVRPNQIALDIRSSMAGKSGGTPPVSNEDANRLIDFLNGRVHKARAEPGKGTQIPPLTPEFKRLLAACAEKALSDNKPWVAGVQISVDHLVAEDFMLAPLLLVAAENWTAPYLASKRQGGFAFSVAGADTTILGYKVTGLTAASPMIVLVAIAAAIRKCCRDGACILDPYLLRFADFIGEIKGNADIFGEADMDAMLIASQE
ncbi:hypothetical protein OIU34_17950 [Pararhizobium sp. BT-229]|uniref:hypothetical protein n=1 Tax=Pararhizobium sp. BT-229 TaxID=2986923 RepID=UPI0021F755C4|nr:hypothetical protein [Pararhizobium sp. BT-229]MCV9963762.1 hypothetical protein [Pararhizobium sp. BT-229]